MFWFRLVSALDLDWSGLDCSQSALPTLSAGSGWSVLDLAPELV